MAVTNTANFAGTYSKSWNVVASADTDLAGTISHGFGATPGLTWLVPLLSANFYGKQWALGTVNASQINLVAISFTGGGTSVAQLAVIAMLPHSLIG